MGFRLICAFISPILIGTNISPKSAVVAVTLHSGRPASKAALAARRCAARRNVQAKARHETKAHETTLVKTTERAFTPTVNSRFSEFPPTAPIVILDLFRLSGGDNQIIDA